MKISELVFIGIKGSVVALNRVTGEQVWTTRLKGSDFVNVVVVGEEVFAATYGEVYCLDPLKGQRLWHNQLKGLGLGLATIATSAGGGSGPAAVMAEKWRRDQEASASNATVMT
jgi:outer membrane protein assembly factor BamB